ncbi:MAG TPA: hypothetical protein VMD02_05785 [Candidatus Omnitrophota bacterium]|nr:hypothetical protein [Candidatus Omnitrophota bacterium]
MGISITQNVPIPVRITDLAGGKLTEHAACSILHQRRGELFDAVRGLMGLSFNRVNGTARFDDCALADIMRREQVTVTNVAINDILAAANMPLNVNKLPARSDRMEDYPISDVIERFLFGLPPVHEYTFTVGEPVQTGKGRPAPQERVFQFTGYRFIRAEDLGIGPDRYRVLLSHPAMDKIMDSLSGRDDLEEVLVNSSFRAYNFYWQDPGDQITIYFDLTTRDRVESVCVFSGGLMARPFLLKGFFAKHPVRMMSLTAPTI